jgi:hypothetical protein
MLLQNISLKVAKAFGVIKLLVLAKPFSGILPITIGEVFYQLVNSTFCFQFCNALLLTYLPTSLGL